MSDDFHIQALSGLTKYYLLVFSQDWIIGWNVRVVNGVGSELYQYPPSNMLMGNDYLVFWTTPLVVSSLRTTYSANTNESIGETLIYEGEYPDFWVRDWWSADI